MDVHEILGVPDATQRIWNDSGTSDFWDEPRMNIGYDNRGIVNHLGFSAGGCELSLLGTVLWPSGKECDPNWQLLLRESAPVEYLGFLIFPRLGVCTGGFHDDDENQRALTVWPASQWDEYLKKSKTPDLSKYQLTGREYDFDK